MDDSESEKLQDELEPIAQPAPGPSPSPITTSAPTPPRQFYGLTQAQHGVHLVIEKPKYENAEVADLEKRIRKAFKDMGYEF